MGTNLEDDTYGSILKALRHPIRWRILKMLNSAPATYTDILKSLGIDNGLLNYHLENLGELVTKLPDERYALSEYGRAAVALNQRVEEPTQREEVTLVGRRMDSKMLKASTALLLVAVVVVSAFFINLYGQNSALSSVNSSLQRENDEYESRLEKLSPLITLENFVKTHSYLKIMYSSTSHYSQDYTMNFYNGTSTKSIEFDGSPWSYIYVPEGGSTLHLDVFVNSGETTKIPVSVQKVRGEYDAFLMNEDDVLFKSEVYPYAELQVPISDSGWYLVSMGPLINDGQGGLSFSTGQGNFALNINIHMSLGGERIPFGTL